MSRGKKIEDSDLTGIIPEIRRLNPAWSLDDLVEGIKDKDKNVLAIINSTLTQVSDELSSLEASLDETGEVRAAQDLAEENRLSGVIEDVTEFLQRYR